MSDSIGPPIAPSYRLLRRVARQAAKKALFGDESPPVRIGRYEVVTTIGCGASGAVFRARDPELDRHVAIKIVEHRPEAAAAVREEARLLARISDPHVVQVFEVGTIERSTYVVMELLEGPTLDVWLHTERSTARRLEMFLQAARGLAACHRYGIVHCDFKPANVVVADGRARVVDFGLAHPSGVTGGGGTPRFMAPEQRHADPVDVRADVYAFCVALDASLADSDERPGTDILASTPRIVADRIRAGLSESPADRPSIDALVEALEAATSQRPKRWPIVAVFAVAALVVGWAIATRRPEAPGPDPRFDGVPIAAAVDDEAPVLLWVDDNPRYNRAEIQHFRDAGYRVALALTLEAAEREGPYDQYAAILSDMERQNERAFDENAGLSLIRRVRETGATTPVFVYTAERLVDVLSATVAATGGQGVAGRPERLYELVEAARRGRSTQ